MKKFKQLTEQLVSLKEYRRGFKSQAAARDVVRSRTFLPAKEGQRSTDATDHTGQNRWVAERPDMPGSGKPDTELLAFNREVQRGIGNTQKRIAKKKAAEKGKVEGAEKARRIRSQTKRMATTEKAAKTLGIPDIDAILKGEHGEGDVAGVTVVGHEKNGYIAMHQGVKHFRHPDGKTHANVELQPSPNGIGVWASRAGNKKSTKAIAYLHPKGDALPVSGSVKSGKVTVDAEDDLNK
jgi:hypothetical protein